MDHKIEDLVPNPVRPPSRVGMGARASHTKMDEDFAKFLNMFKKIEVNIPFAKALAQMSHYAKFMKDILSKKRKLDEEGVVSLSATCSVVIQKNLPLKM